MNEKELIEKAEEIIEALTSLSMGKEPGLMSGKVFKNLSTHPQFIPIRDCYIKYLQSFDGKSDDINELKRIGDLRIEIVTLYDKEQ